MTLPASTLGRLVLLALATLILSGCANPRAGLIRRDSAAGLYDRAIVQYELDASQLNLPLALTQVEGQLVSYNQVPSHPVPGATRGQLTITYPHPNGNPSQAFARVDIASEIAQSNSLVPPPPGNWTSTLRRIGRSVMTGGGHPITESWELTISKPDLDQVMGELNKAGYFEGVDPASTGATISARLDGKSVRRTWEQVAELDALMQRVRNEGQLVAYQRPAAFRTDPTAGSSVTAYRDLRQRELLRDLATERALVSAPLPGWSAGRHGLADPTPPAQSNVARLPSIDGPARY